MTFAAQSSCLLLIDLQARLMPAILQSARVTDCAKRLVDAARYLDIPVYATEQNRAGLGPTIGELVSYAQGVLQKQHFDATREPAWTSFLPEHCRDIIVCGVEAHVCVLQSVIGLMLRGRRIKVVKDAVGSRTAENRDAALHRMEWHGAELVTSEMVIFEWLQTCDHPQFRNMLRLVKGTGSEQQKNEHY